VAFRGSKSPSRMPRKRMLGETLDPWSERIRIEV
jgi:hypothetical protein